MGKDVCGHFFFIHGKPCHCASGPCMGSAWRSAVDLRRLSPESTVHTLSHCPGFCLCAEFDLSLAHPRHVRAGNEQLSVIRSAQSQVCSEPLRARVLGWHPQPYLSSCSAFCRAKQGLGMTRTQGACITDSRWAVSERLTASFLHQLFCVTVVTNPSPTGAQGCVFATGAPSYHLYPEATEEGGQTRPTPPPSPRVQTLKRPPQGMCSARSGTLWGLGSVVIPHGSPSKHVTCLRSSFPPAGLR